MLVALTARQQAFVDAYAGNATEAAKAAGYPGNAKALASQGSRLLANAKVKAALALRSAKVEAVRSDVAAAGRIATRAERQAFWTATMLDTAEEMSARLKASELLGKSEVDFTDKLQVDAKVTLEQLVAQAAAKK